MNRLFKVLLLVVMFLSTGCSDILKSLLSKDNPELEPEPVPVSMKYDTVLHETELESSTASQFYLRNHSFSYFCRTYFKVGDKTLRLFVSSGEGFELNKWYPVPTDETELVWESFGEIKHPKYTEKAIQGRVRFVEFQQIGKLNSAGEGYCRIRGEFELTVLDPNNPAVTSEVAEGKFYVPKSKYWDTRSVEL